jgi:23S rRNA pseudouridine2605 synthase
VSFGPFQLGELKTAEVEEIRGKVLRDQLGAKLAEAAHADFAAPIRKTDAEEKQRGARPKRAKFHARGRRTF